MHKIILAGLLVLGTVATLPAQTTAFTYQGRLARNGTPGGVNNAALANGAVDSAKIADGSITTNDLSTAVLSNTFWRLTGNAGTTPGANFLGTTDNQALRIQGGGQPTAIYIATNGSIGIGTAAPVNALLDVEGVLRMNNNEIALGAFAETGSALGTPPTWAGQFVNGVLLRGHAGGLLGTSFDEHNLNNARFSLRWDNLGNVLVNSNLYVNTSVGIGTTTPAAQLDVSGPGGNAFPQLRLDQTSANDYARLRFTQRSNYNHRWDLAANSNTFVAYSGYFGREFLHADLNGVSFGNNNVGVGTATPASKFTVLGSAVGGFVSPLAFIENTNGTGNSGPALRVKGSGNPLDGVLSVASHGIGLIARFGYANTWVSSLDTNGHWCATSFNPCSDRNVKENFAPVDPQEVLAKVTALPISTWNYRQDTESKHIGPMAQDFWAAFGTGLDDKHIATVDADGVALAAIQGLNEKVEERLRAKDAEIRELRQSLAELKALVQSQSR